jgi:heterokaryon incompatibility protein (HET)
LNAAEKVLNEHSIIQDSPEDWEVEAALMDKVYMNSSCTIAACESQSSANGIHVARNPQVAMPLSFSEIYLDRTAYFKLIPDWVTPIKKTATLFQRGWILQERLLSPRIIYMCRFPFLDCRRGTITESRPLSYTNQDAGYVIRNYTPGYNTRDYPISFEGWKMIVGDYSKTKLSFPSDKLIALAGVARQFHSKIKSDYLAGLWGGKHLIPSLLWRCILRGKIPANYRGKYCQIFKQVKSDSHHSTIVVMGVRRWMDILRYPGRLQRAAN